MFYASNKQSGTTRNRAAIMIVAACMTSFGMGGISAIFASPAHAAMQDEVRTKVVRYADLNLAEAQGRQALDLRIRRAAKQVCTLQGIEAIVQRREMRQCAEIAHSKAWAIAQQRIGDYRLAVRAPE